MPATEPERSRPSPTARVIAPLALVTAAVLVFAVVSASVGGDEDPAAEPEPATTASACEPSEEQSVADGYYVLQSGEDLGVVAEKTCIEVEELLELNPNLDPQQLPINACIDLAVDGCKALAEG